MGTRSWLRFSLVLVCSCSGADRGALLAALASPDPIVRASAVQKLAARKDPIDLGYLVGRVSDPDPLVRESVARGLGLFDERRSTEALAILVSDPVEAVQLVAVDSLASQKNPRAFSYLLLAYQQGGAAVRARVIEVLARTGHDPAEAIRAEARALWSQLSKALSRGNMAERVAAAEGLGRSGRPEAVERLATYLGADSPPLALAASRGLGESGAAEARAPLEALLNDDSIDLRIAGAEALGRLGDPEAVTALARLVPEGGRPGQAAVDALEKLLVAGGAGKATLDVKPLCAAMLVDDEDIARRMAALTRRSGIACDARPLLGRMQTSSPAGRAALAAIGELGVAPASVPMVVKRLSEILRYGPSSMRPTAARVAGRLRLEDLQPLLEKTFAEGASQLARSRARWVTAGAGAPESLFAEDAQDTVALQAEAGLALVRLGGAAQLEACKQMAVDPAPAIREQAAEAVLALPAAAGWPLLQALLADPQLSVHERAVAALADFDPHAQQPGQWLLAALQKGDDRVSPSTLLAALARRPPIAGGVEMMARELRQSETAGAAAEALGRQEPSQAGPILVARLAELPSAGLIELIAASSTMKLTTAVPSLQALRFHPRPEVAAAAAAALWKLDSAHAQNGLSLLAEDYYLEVRRAAAGAPPG